MSNWLTISQSAGTGNATITVNAQGNPTFEERTARIVVSNGTISKTVSVVQQSKTPQIDYLLISGPDYYTLPYSGGSITSGTVESDLIIYAHYENYPPGQGLVDVTSASTINFDRAQVSASCTTNIQIEMKDWFYVSASYSGISTNKTVWIYQEGVPETNRIVYSASTPIVFTSNAINNFGANIIASGYSNGSGVYVFDGQVTEFYGNASCMITPETKGALTGIDVPSSLTNLGQNVFNGCSALTSVNGLENTENVYLPPENAGNGAFYNCTSLTHCGLPHSYQYWSGGAIKADVFYGCSSLTTIIYNGTESEWNAISKNSNWRRNSAVRYVQCTDGTIDLDNPSINNTITYYATEQLNIPDSATTPSIISHTFSNGVGTIKASGDITVWGNTDSVCESNSGLTAIILPSTVERIGTRAFKNCTSLSACTIPESLKTMGVEAFENTQITEVTIPSGFTMFDYWTGATWYNYGAQFHGCSGLTSITIQSTQIQVMTNYLFYWLYNVNNLTINYSGTISQWLSMSFSPRWKASLLNDSVRYVQCLDGLIDLRELNNTIYYYAPEQLTIADSATTPSFTSHTFNDGVGTIKTSGNVTEINVSGFTNCSDMTNIILPNTVESIGSYAFTSAMSLTNIAIPNSVTAMGDYVFWRCTGLTSVNISTGITTIPYSTFSTCSSLTGITIPDNITTISGYSFYKCNSLEEITIPSSVTTIGSNAFSNCSALETINYNGTITQWNNVLKYGGWHSGAPATVVHCTNGDVTL